jgi:tRNA threonylcarbamoyladenosine biosynthesis protein TsaB
MYILHLETSTKVCSVALSQDGACIALKESNTDDYQHAEQLTIFIQDVLTQSSLTLKQLNAVSVSSGPGSYTGLRIGVSTAKGLCYALEIPLVSVDSLYALAKVASETYPDKQLCAMIDARRMEVYSAIYSPDMGAVKSISADILDEDSYSEFGPMICIGDGVGKIKELWKGTERFIDEQIVCSARGQIDLAYEKMKREEFEDLAYFEPFYLKDFVLNTKKM